SLQYQKPCQVFFRYPINSPTTGTIMFPSGVIIVVVDFQPFVLSVVSDTVCQLIIAIAYTNQLVARIVPFHLHLLSAPLFLVLLACLISAGRLSPADKG